MIIASRKSADSESPGDPLMIMKICLLVSGIYIWEFITTLDFEWNVIRRHQRYRWTIWIYSVSRLSGLAVMILLLINFYRTSPINCHAWVISIWVFSALGGYCLSSILIMLRIFAIWDKNKVIMTISAAIWVINLGFQLEGIAKIRAEWIPAARACAITNIEICRNFYINLIVTDVVLLFIMLAGLLRLRRNGRGSYYLAHLLWKQGVIWLVIATAAEFPQVLFLFLNLNDSLNFMFLLPSMAAIIIAATRTYRSLIHSALLQDIHLGEPDSRNVQKDERLVSRTKDSSVTHKPSTQLEITVHRAYHGEYPMSKTSHYGDGPNPTLDEQITDKPHGLVSDDDVEGRIERN